MTEAAVPYEEGLKTALADPQEAVAYLNAALEESDQAIFLLALRDVAEANGISMAQTSELNRENLYSTLSQGENPQLSSLNALLKAVGLRLAVELEHV